MRSSGSFRTSIGEASSYRGSVHSVASLSSMHLVPAPATPQLEPVYVIKSSGPVAPVRRGGEGGSSAVDAFMRQQTILLQLASGKKQDQQHGYTPMDM